jgi:hypothetical protein
MFVSIECYAVDIRPLWAHVPAFTGSYLQVAIFMAKDAEGFCNACDQLGRHHA